MNRDFKHVGGRRTGLLLRRLRTCVRHVNGRQVLSREVSFNLVSPCGTRIRCLEKGVGKDDFLHPFHDLVAMGAMSNFRKRRESIVFVDLMHTGRSKRVKFLGSLQQVGMTVAETQVGLIVLKSTSALAGRPFCGELVLFVGGRSWVLGPPFGGIRFLAGPRFILARAGRAVFCFASMLFFVWRIGG